MTAVAVRAGLARNWAGILVVIVAIWLVWFLLQAPGCGSGGSGTTTTKVPAALSARGGVPVAPRGPGTASRMLPRWSGSSSS